MMKIVINSSPLIFLAKLQFLELFLDSDDLFYIPPAVLEEIEAKSDEVSLAILPLIKAEKLQVLSTRLLFLVNRLNLNLGRGESEAISLATELQAGFTILDDRAARKRAINLGLNVKGTLAIIKKLSQEDKITINNLDEFYQRLRQINFRVSRSIFETVFTK